MCKFCDENLIRSDNIDCHDLFVGDIPINYCPFCGRKLDGKYYIRNEDLIKLIDICHGPVIEK